MKRDVRCGSFFSAGRGRVGQVRAALEVERLQTLDGGQLFHAGVGDVGVIERQVLEFGQSLQAGHAGVADLGAVERQSLQVSQAGNRLQIVVGGRAEHQVDGHDAAGGIAADVGPQFRDCFATLSTAAASAAAGAAVFTGPFRASAAGVLAAASPCSDPGGAGSRQAVHNRRCTPPTSSGRPAHCFSWSRNPVRERKPLVEPIAGGIP